MDNQKKTNTEEPSLKRYETDVSGVSLKTLERGLWWAKNRTLLKKTFITILGILAFGSLSYALFGFAYYYSKSFWDDKKMVTVMVNTTTVSFDFLLSRLAKDPAISSVGILENSDSYDLYVNISNPNLKHWGVFSYCFSAGQEKVQCGKGHLLPGERKVVSALSAKKTASSGNFSFSIDSMDWKRISPRQISDWEQYKKERLKIEITNISFKPAAGNELSEKIGLNSLSFDVANLSAYGFWEAPLQINLYRSNRLVGINRYLLKEFNSYNRQEIKMTWPGDFSGVNSVEVIPDINIMNADNYLRPSR